MGWSEENVLDNQDLSQTLRSAYYGSGLGSTNHEHCHNNGRICVIINELGVGLYWWGTSNKV